MAFFKSKANKTQDETLQMAVCFADVCGSTRLYEDLGDKTAQELVGRVLEVASEVVAQNRGRVIKTLGDAVMACFDQPTDGLTAARAINSRVSRLTPPPGAPRLAVHVGLQWGEVVPREGDLFGDAVNVASRLSDLAKPGQILTGSETLEAAGNFESGTTRAITRIRVRGRKKELLVHEVIWEEADLTLCQPSPLGQLLEQGDRLELRYKDQVVTVDNSCPRVTMGRVPGNELEVPRAWVSRNHAKVEQRMGRFVLVDKSTNGTYLRLGSRKPILLKLGEMEISGEGVINLGRDQGPEGEDAIRFKVIVKD